METQTQSQLLDRYGKTVINLQNIYKILSSQSAGGVAVTQLMVSPMAQGLFHKAIAASGSALNAWGTSIDPIPGALDVAARVDCYDFVDQNPDLTQIGACMRALTNASYFVQALMDYQVEFLKILLKCSIFYSEHSKKSCVRIAQC